MQIPSFRVDDQIALVTGSGRGIGEAIAHGLAAHGAHVVITEVPDRLEAAREVAATIERDYGHRTLAVPLDVTSLASINDAMEATVGHFGRIDILVNNAGINIPKYALDVTEEDWDRVLDIDLKGVFFCCQAAGRKMVAQQRGKIINIASQMGVVGYQRRAAYCSAKAGVVNLTRVLAFEWAQHSVLVNAIGPTFIESALSAGFWQDPAFKADVMLRLPIGRIGKPEDVVGAAIYLASPAADLVTGHTLLVDGGWTAA
ncbi:MAG: glucose 1-dehydrogenase [Chloroflexi bacterium]|nr:glucose 1-dehydrogenase [Chloroflexota bacterium]